MEMFLRSYLFATGLIVLATSSHIRGSSTLATDDRANLGCGGQSLRKDGYPDGHGTPAEYCPHCRKCCSCNANGAMDCEQSTVSVGGAVVFCSTCQSSCSTCPAFKSMTMCPNGDCCAPGWKHQPPFDATRGVGAYGFHLVSSQVLKEGPKASKKPVDAKDGSKKEDLMKKMPLKAQEQGFEGEKVKHSDGKTGTSDWLNEHGSKQKQSAPPPPKKSGSIRCGIGAAMLLAIAAL